MASWTGFQTSMRPFTLDVTPIDDENFLVCHMIFHFWKFQWSIRHSSHYQLDISSLLIFLSDDDGKIRFGNFVWKNQRIQSRNSCLPWPSSDTIFPDSSFSWFCRNFSILLWRWFRRLFHLRVNWIKNHRKKSWDCDSHLHQFFHYYLNHSEHSMFPFLPC